MQTQVQHTHLAVCSTQSSTKGGPRTEGRHLTKGVLPPAPGSQQVLGQPAARPPWAKKYAPLSMVYIY